MEFGAAEVPLTTWATFKLALSLGSKSASLAHFASRLQKAPLRETPLSLEVPAGAAAQMWHTTVLAQALYGCEIREVSHAQLRPLCAQGKSGISNKVPLELSNYCEAEAVCGPPLGACAARNPRMEAATRRMRWLITLANQVGLVGTIHRHLATVSLLTWYGVPLACALVGTRWAFFGSSNGGFA